MKWVPRRRAERLAALLRAFPAVLISGPRQSGKSTLARRLLPAWRFLDLERPADLGAPGADFEGFSDANPRRVVIDEAQRLPELSPLLRHVIDRSPRRGVSCCWARPAPRSCARFPSRSRAESGS